MREIPINSLRTSQILGKTRTSQTPNEEVERKRRQKLLELETIKQHKETRKQNVLYKKK
jgi:hypothetical protein